MHFGAYNIILVGPQGRSDRYTGPPDGAGNYRIPAGVYTSLQKRGDGSYLATAQDQSTLTFDACGHLRTITDRYTNTSTLTYDAATYHLTSASDPAGRGSLTFGYYNDANGRLHSVTDWAGRTVQYDYDTNGRLWHVTDRAGTVTTFGYDGTSARLASVTDGRSPGIQVLTVSYNAARQVAWTRDAQSYQTSFDYSSGNGATATLSAAAYPLSTAPQVMDAYQGQGWLSTHTTKASNATGETYTVSYGYDALGNRTTETDANGNTTNYCYDTDYAGQAIPGSRGNLTRKIAPSVTVTDSSGSRSSRPTHLYKYDSHNNLIEEYSPNGVTTDAAVTCTTDLRTHLLSAYRVARQYDGLNELLSVTRQVTDPDAGLKTAITKYEYDATERGQVVTEIPPRGNTDPNTPDYSYATRHTYYHYPDPQASLRKDTTDPASNKTSYTYDSVGRRLTQVDPRGNASGANPAQYTWSYRYDNEDRLLEKDAPDPNGNTSPAAPLRTRYGYDAVGNRTSVTDARGYMTRYVYDARNLLSEVKQSPSSTDPLNDTNHIRTLYTYDGLGSLQQMRRQLASAQTPQRTFDYQYDGLRRLRSETEHPAAGASTRSYSYDGNGNLHQATKPAGTITYTYDALNHPTQISYSTTTTTVQYTYDANGSRHSMTGSATLPTELTTYSYDERDQLTQVSFGTLGKTVGYRYDLDGHRKQLIYPNGQRLTYNLDTAGRIASLSDWATPARVTSYSYYPNGQISAITNPSPNSSTQSRTYDYAGRLQSITNRFANQSIITFDSYNCEAQTVTCVDAIGNPTFISGSASRASNGTLATYSITYRYDGLNRVTQYIDTDTRGGTAAATATFDYAGNSNQYAATNNRAKVTANPGTTTYDYDGADRMVTVTPPGSSPGSYTYDADGNLYTAPHSLFISHDVEDRMGVYDDDSDPQHPRITNFYYDADGLLAKKDGATTNQYLWDVALGVPQLLEDASLRYVYGPGGLVYATDLGGTSMLYVYHLDGQGSVRALSAGGIAASQVLFSSSYDPFGVAVYQENIGAGQPFGYTGAYFDPDAQLHYLRARWYNPVSGRFIERDSGLGERQAPNSLNRYIYAQNNPLAYQDPTGHFVDPFWWYWGWGVPQIGGNVMVPIGGEEPGECWNTGVTCAQMQNTLLNMPAELGGLGGGGLMIGGAAVGAGSLYGWGRANTLARHFRDHGAAIGAANELEYARMAQEFLIESQQRGFPTLIDPDGVIRVYDPARNWFGAFNPDGSTRTFFAPSSPTYWQRNASNWGSPPWIAPGP